MKRRMTSILMAAGIAVKRRNINDVRFSKVLLLAIGVVLSTHATTAAIIYVNAAAPLSGADGSSWRSAFPSLQSALEAAHPGDQIWVAQGKYTPSKVYSPSNTPGGASGQNVPALKTFNLPSDIAVFGGFAGTERDISSRDPVVHATTLDGATTSWHIVTAGNDVAQTGVEATLDGLIISNGNAQGPDPVPTYAAPFSYAHDSGAGLYVAFGSHIKVNNVSFLRNNASLEGAAIYSINSNLTVTNCNFYKNSSGSQGGAIEVLNTFQSAPPYKTTGPYIATISTSRFDSNSTLFFGGAMVGEGTFPNPESTVTLDEDVFTNNTAEEGGAVVFDSQKSFVTKSLFDHNTASVNGGALTTTNVVDTFSNAGRYGVAASFPKFATTIQNSVFTNNVAQGNQAIHDGMLGGPAAGLDFALGGGALVAYMNGYLSVTSSEFFNNVAQNGPGGAILNGDAAGNNLFGLGVDAFVVSTSVTHCTFGGNKALSGNGGAIASQPDSVFSPPERTVASTALSVADSLFVGNSATGDGGALYLNDSTGTLHDNLYQSNHAVMGNSILATMSIVNGSSIPISQ